MISNIVLNDHKKGTHARVPVQRIKEEKKEMTGKSLSTRIFPSFKFYCTTVCDLGGGFFVYVKINVQEFSGKNSYPQIIISVSLPFLYCYLANTYKSQ